MRWILLLLVLLTGFLAWMYFTPGTVEVREVEEEESSPPPPPSPPATPAGGPAPPATGPRPEAGPAATTPAPGAFRPANSTASHTAASSSTHTSVESLTEIRARTAEEVAASLILKDDHGNPRLVSREEAVKACEALGGYVATMRQWAEHGARKGAFGIIEVKEVVSGNVAPPLSHSVDGTEEMTYYLVRALDPDGKKDQFYYNPRGYRPSSHAFGRLLLHTSSVDEKGRAFAFGMNGANGVLGGQQAGANREGPHLAYASCWKREK